MGMSIDKAQSNLRNIQRYYIKADNETIDFAIDILRKYQKIQEIVRWNNAPSPYYKPDGQLFREICEVLEDGKMDKIERVQYKTTTEVSDVAWQPCNEQEDENDIRFYIPDGLTIPTDLILYVGDTYVSYNRIKGGFRFHILEDDEAKAMDIAKQIADRMEYEHDESEHGVTWCTVKFEVVEQDERYKIRTDIDWFYRVRDSY